MAEHATDLLKRVDNDLTLLRDELFNHIRITHNKLEKTTFERDELEKELKKLRDEYKRLETKYEAVFKELGDFKAIEKEALNGAVFITSPEDFFKYPERIQGECFNSMPWDHISLSYLLEIMEIGITNEKFQVVEKALVAVTDYYIRTQRITDSQWHNIASVLTKYIDKQVEIKTYSLEAIFFLFTQVTSQGWVDLLGKLMRSKGTKIEEIIINMCTKQSLDYGVRLLEIYFLLSMEQLAKDWITIVMQVPNYAEVMDKKSLLNFMYFGIYYSYHVHIYNNLPSYNKIGNLIEVECCKKYNMFLLNATSKQLPELSSNITKMTKNLDFIDSTTRNRIVGLMIKNMERAVLENKQKNIVTKQDKKAKSKKSKFNNPSKPDSRGLAEIFILTKSAKNCPNCSDTLSMAKALLAHYDKKGENIIGDVEAEVLYCNNCRNHFIDHVIQSNIFKSTNGKKIKTKMFEKNGIKIAMNTVKSGGQISGSEYKRPNTEVNGMSKGNGMKYKLKDKSELGALGYKISKSNRDERWKVITVRAIPNLGPEKIIKIIANNIRLRKRQRGGALKFSYAISEWEHDIQRIENEYIFKKQKAR